MGLILYFFDAPELVAVSDEMPQFMGGVKSRSRAVILIRAEHNHGPIREGQRECVHIRSVKGEADYQNSLLLERPHDILDGPTRQAEHLPCLQSYVLKLSSGRSELGHGHPEQ